jgi:hypothetical protein
MRTSATRVLTPFALFLALSLPLTAGEKKNEPVAKSSGSAASIEWQTTVDHERLLLTVAGPDGRYYTKDFPSGKPVTFRASDLDKAATDGTYIYELRLVPRISADVKRRLTAARAAGNDEEVTRIQQEAGIAHTTVQSGAFTVKGGGFIMSDAAEPDANDANAVAGDSGSGAGVSSAGTTAKAKFGAPVANANVIADDLIVQGSECVGIDCSATESFGFDTLRLKENNLRINFDDTSSSAGFPAGDWRLSANDSASGGANKFTIEDATNNTVPVTIMAAAPTNAMFLASDGNLGLGTATPTLDLSINTGNTPAVRLAQDTTGGFTAQTWDVGANEANFFVRDVTGGSKLSFRIRPGAPTSSIDIAASGRVGMGTASPSQKVHVYDSVDNQTLLVVENPNTGVNAAGTVRADSDIATLDIKSHSSTRNITRFGQLLSGWNELLAVAGNGLAIGTQTSAPLILGTNSTNIVEIGAAGGVTVTGNFTVTGTKQFAMEDPADPTRAIHYVALEGPEAGTYVRGTAKTVKGEVVIDLPGFFSRITEKEKMTVQLTPVGGFAQLYVASRTPQQIVIKSADPEAEIEFDYFVQGIRKGYMDFQVERKNELPK